MIKIDEHTNAHMDAKNIPIRVNSLNAIPNSIKIKMGNIKIPASAIAFKKWSADERPSVVRLTHFLPPDTVTPEKRRLR